MYENIVDKYISKKGASITYSLALPAILLEIVNIKIKLSNKIMSLPIHAELFLEKVILTRNKLCFTNLYH